MRLQDIISSNIYEPNKKYNSRHYLKDLSIFYTEAKITPKKEGFFVTFYKRINNKNEAFSSGDLIDYLIIKLNNQQYIFFSKEDLIRLNIISFNSIKGKMGLLGYLMGLRDVKNIWDDSIMSYKDDYEKNLTPKDIRNLNWLYNGKFQN